MAIRIVLNDQGDSALKDTMGKLKSYSPELRKIQNALVSQAIIDLNESLSEARMKALAEKLLSRPSKRKMIFEKIGALAQKLDEASFQSLESSIKKVCGQFDKVDSNPRGMSTATK